MDTSDMRRALLMAARRHPELLKGLKTTVRIDSMPYRRSHGAAPRGTGSWAFTFTKGQPTREVTTEMIWWAPTGTFTEACRAAKEEARRRFPGVSIVWAEVQP